MTALATVMSVILSVAFCGYGHYMLKVAKADLAAAKDHWEKSRDQLERCSDAIKRNEELLDEVRKIHHANIYLHSLCKATQQKEDNGS